MSGFLAWLINPSQLKISAYRTLLDIVLASLWSPQSPRQMVSLDRPPAANSQTSSSRPSAATWPWSRLNCSPRSPAGRASERRVYGVAHGAEGRRAFGDEARQRRGTQIFFNAREDVHFAARVSR